MLSKNKIKYIHSLELKKTRKEEQVFLAEGPKLTGDLLGHFPCRFLAATSSWLQAHPDIQANEIAEVSQEELSRASLLKTPQQVLAVFEQPQYMLSPEFARQSLCLALDDIQDPGNLGTIIRLADWFGIEHIICSQNTVDVYNPKENFFKKNFRKNLEVTKKRLTFANAFPLKREHERKDSSLKDFR